MRLRITEQGRRVYETITEISREADVPRTQVWTYLGMDIFRPEGQALLDQLLIDVMTRQPAYHALRGEVL